MPPAPVNNERRPCRIGFLDLLLLAKENMQHHAFSRLSAVAPWPMARMARRPGWRLANAAGAGEAPLRAFLVASRSQIGGASPVLTLMPCMPCIDYMLDLFAGECIAVQ